MNQKTSTRPASAAPRAAELDLSATTGARADGVATNTVTATLKDADGQYVSNTPVTFFILLPSSAVFTGGTQQVQVNTSTLGEASADLTDTEAETVSITASATSLSSQTSTTFTSGDGGLLLPPVIEGIFNQSVYLDEMTDPVYINVSGTFLAGDEIVLYLTGEDASGLSVPDKSYSHRVTTDTYQVAFAVPLDELRKYGGTDTHPNDAGTLDIFYTLNNVESLHSSYSVYGTGGVVSHNYTITGNVISGSVPADGVSYCTVKWEVQDDGVPVSGLGAILAVGGNAHFTVVSSGRDQSGAATLPAEVNYTDTSAQMVVASAVLNGYPDTLTTVELVFHNVDTYTVHADIVRNGAPADGSTPNQVAWSVTDQTGAEVSGLAATATVDGNAVMSGGTTSQPVVLPLTLNYTDVAAESVQAGMVLTEGGASATADLSFSDDMLGCRNIESPGSIGYQQLTAFLQGFRFVEGRRYKVTLTIPSDDAYDVKWCPAGYIYTEQQDVCISTATPVVVEPAATNTKVFFLTSAAGGDLNGLNCNTSILMTNNRPVEVCVTTA